MSPVCTSPAQLVRLSDESEVQIDSAWLRPPYSHQDMSVLKQNYHFPALLPNRKSSSTHKIDKEILKREQTPVPRPVPWKPATAWHRLLHVSLYNLSWRQRHKHREPCFHVNCVHLEHLQYFGFDIVDRLFLPFPAAVWRYSAKCQNVFCVKTHKQTRLDYIVKQLWNMESFLRSFSIFFLVYLLSSF